MMFSRLKILIPAVVLLAAPLHAVAQGPPGRGGPAKVVARPGLDGVIAPVANFRGTVYFKEVSEVATEVSGKVLSVEFDDGDRVKAGQLLVRLDDTLLTKELQSIRATLSRHSTNLEEAEVRYERARTLVDDGLATSEEGDELRFEVISLQHQAAATRSDVEGLEALIEKNSVYAPFDGIVVERLTDLGEWRKEGDTVAVIARTNAFEIVVDVPESHLPWIRPGRTVEVRTGNTNQTGTVAVIVPRGDIATRTFEVKVDIQPEGSLYEGMSASVSLPTGAKTECVLAPRDALLNQLGQTVLFTVDGAVARRWPVKVLGYEGLFAGIQTPGISADDLFIVKGHERLREGAQIQVIESDERTMPPEHTDD